MDKNRISYSVSELPAATGLSRSKCYALIAEGKIPAHDFGGKTIVLADDVRKVIEQAPSYTYTPKPREAEAVMA